MTLGTSLAGLAVIFAHTEDLRGWSPAELVALLGVYLLMGGLIGLVIQPSMQRFMEDVRSGTLDFTLWLQKIGSFNGTDCHIVTCGASEDRVSMLLTETRSNPLQEDTASEVQQTSCFGPFSQAP